jgi:hypothetical protein
LVLQKTGERSSEYSKSHDEEVKITGKIRRRSNLRIGKENRLGYSPQVLSKTLEL